MEFNCPACSAPHAFPDDQVPEGGIVVACTRCAAHVTLTSEGVVDPAARMRTSALEAPPDMDEPLAQTSAGMEAVRVAAAPAPEPAAPAREAAAPRVEARREAPRREPEPSFGEAAPAQPPRDVAPEGRRAGLGLREAASAAKEKAREAADAGRRALDAAAQAETGGAPPATSLPSLGARSDVWTARDLPKAFLGAFDARRIVYTAAGFWVALNAFTLLRWLGGWLGAKITGIIATVFGIAAWGVLVAGVAIVAAIVGSVCHQVIVEGRPTPVSDGIEWTKRHLTSVIGTPLAFVAVIAALALAEGVVGGIGRIPWAGPIVWGLASPAIFAASLVAGIVAVALIYSLPIYIPVIYNEGTGPKETLVRLLTLFRIHGFTLVGLLLVATVMVWVATAATVIPAWYVANLVSSNVGVQAMGPNLAGLFASAPGEYPAWLVAALNPATLMSAASGLSGGPNFSHTLGGLLAGLLGGTALVSLVLAIPALATVSAGAIIHAIITKRAKPAAT